VVDSLLGGGHRDRDCPSFSVGILGDLHLEPKQMHLFEEAREHFISHLVHSGTPGPRIVQLGDLGGYSNRPGKPTVNAGSPDILLIIYCRQMLRSAGCRGGSTVLVGCQPKPLPACLSSGAKGRKYPGDERLGLLGW
jgi:hypothetical protein